MKKNSTIWLNILVAFALTPYANAQPLKFAVSLTHSTFFKPGQLRIVSENNFPVIITNIILNGGSSCKLPNDFEALGEEIKGARKDIDANTEAQDTEEDYHRFRGLIDLYQQGVLEHQQHLLRLQQTYQALQTNHAQNNRIQFWRPLKTWQAFETPNPCKPTQLRSITIETLKNGATTYDLNFR
ncbi:hypothetical protein NHP21005_03590 [Helicobacter sp. NHP21005]|uniref:hypothetical protein n=1 Tax=Helicobacter felistomachi TaxID=3040201 RepID=UPI0025727A2B|nr:hypothetical protein [Helicobacter sp. NHP21005]BEG56671.1 hypothetical protein NHP21005_03590 [Helicobacter sp. NHP21005]